MPSFARTASAVARSAGWVRQRGGAGLARDVLELAGGQREIRWHVDQLGPRAAEPGEQVAIRIAPVGEHAFARLQAGGEQAARHPVGGEVERGVAPVPPAEGQRRPVAEPPGGAPQRVADGVPPGPEGRRLRLGRHACPPTFAGRSRAAGAPGRPTIPGGSAAGDRPTGALGARPGHGRRRLPASRRSAL
jgi:hypothetical protein